MSKFNASRREWIARASMLTLGTAITQNSFPADLGTALPAKDLFKVKGTYLNAAFTHPMSISTAKAAQAYIERRMTSDRAADQKMDSIRDETKVLFAKLINASPEEIAYVPSTMVGENLVVSGLGLPGTNARVVTDALHFEASLYLYGQLAKMGLNVTVVPERSNKIDLNDLDAAIKPGTRLVALSLVSTVNGFQHDLKAVCDLAHSRGALVYADIIQAVGAVPVDVKATGVDFCATASYKWLMGDFGLGFLYVRKDRLEQMKRSQYGYRQIAEFKSYNDFKTKDDVGGYFQVGTFASPVIAALNDSLGYILKTGVDKIQAHRLPLIKMLQEELPKLGYASMTPLDSTSPVLAFACNDAYKLKPRLDAAGVDITLYENRFRVSPSVYNDIKDVKKLIEALK